MEQLLIVFLVITILVTFYLYVSIRKMWGFWVFLGTFIFWLVPIYPIMILVANVYPKYGESCGIFGCAGSMMGFFCGLGWFVLFPIAAILVSMGCSYYFKIDKKQSLTPEVNKDTNPKKYYAIYMIGIFILLCLGWLLFMPQPHREIPSATAPNIPQ